MYPIFVEWHPPENPEQLYQVPLIHFYEDNTVLLMHKKQFFRVSIETVRFARFNY